MIRSSLGRALGLGPLVKGPPAAVSGRTTTPNGKKFLYFKKYHITFKTQLFFAIKLSDPHV